MSAVTGTDPRSRPSGDAHALHLLIDQLPAPVALLDLDMRYVAASEPFLRDFEIRDIEGRRDPELFPRDLAGWTCAYRRALCGGIERREADLFERADGRVHWRTWEMRPWYDEAGRIAGVIAYSTDVTASKHARDAAAAAERERDAEVDVLDRLCRLAQRTVSDAELPVLLLEIVDAAIAITDADFGGIRLVEPGSSMLRIAAQRGFSEAWVAFWNGPGQGRGSCAAALARGERVVVENVEECEIITDAAVLAALRNAGVRAAQSTPLVASSGSSIGVFSTCYKTPRRPSDHKLRRLDLLARLAADCIEHVRVRAALSKSEARLRALVSATTYVTYSMSPDWSELRELDGRGFLMDKEAPSRNWLAEYIEPEDQARVMQAVRSAIDTRGPFELMHRVRAADGSISWTLSRAIPLLDSQGDVTEWFGAASDMTEYLERKRTELELRAANAQLERAVAERTAALQQSESRLKLILDSTSDAVVTVDASGKVVTFNRSAQHLLGYGIEEIVGQDFGMLFSAIDRAVNANVLGRYLRTQAPRILGRERRLDVRHRDGSLRPVALTINATDQFGLFVACLRDLTQTKALEDEVLNRAVLEQQRLGEELHDGTQQELAGLGLLAHALAERLEREGLAESAALGTRIGAGLSAAAANVRRLARGLVPLRLEARDLAPALVDLALGTSRDCGIECRFESSGAVVPRDSHTATHLHRIAQEAVTNAVRHAEPRRIWVRLGQSGDSLTLEIADDGIGIALQSSSFRGAGLRLMEHRSSVLGGHLEVALRDGGGTVIRSVVPAARTA